MFWFCFLVFSGVHNMCKILPNSLKTQELNCKSRSQRWSGGVQNFPSIADGRYVHASRCWKRRRGENELTSGQQKITTQRNRIHVDLDHLTQFNQDAQWKVNVRDCVSSGADGGAACTFTRQFRSEAEVSSGGTWFLFADHGECLRCLTFLENCLNKIPCATGSHFIALCTVVWINIARVVQGFPCRIKSQCLDFSCFVGKKC